jgi:hypothetical protein
MENLIAWGLTTLGSAFIGSFLASYLKKKGENLATHEDLDKLVEQVRVVETTTQEIEAKISSDVWDRQKRWEMKRDVLFEATKRLRTVEGSLMDLQNTYETARRNPLGAGWAEFKVKANQQWFDEKRKFEETCLLMAITCGKDVKEACDDIRAFMTQIAAKINKDDTEIYAKSSRDLLNRVDAVTTAIRKELETDKTT